MSRNKRNFESLCSNRDSKSKRIRNEMSSPSSDSDSELESDSGLSLSSIDSEDSPQIYNSMLSNNPAAVKFLFSASFTAPLGSVLESADLSRKYDLQVSKLVQEFRRLLAIKLFTVDEDATKISPTPLMDEIWHAAILDTRFYADLQAGLGATLHHRPSGASDEETVSRERRLAVMKGIYRANFSADPLTPGYMIGRHESPPSSLINTSIRLARSSGVQIFVKTLTGKKIELTVRGTSLVQDLKATIKEIEGISEDWQRLIFAGQLLQEGRSLSSYAVQEESVIHLVTGLRGC
ncbi:hypothetical protein VTL71DRAFT_14103 [Oculimacula yallundae]|uniref:Ubiquitin-like domain-containing protein n=1 Tax=Oculimacula yallundae TaxID=86028 RepID=A0ABR4CJV9_9HELO